MRVVLLLGAGFSRAFGLPVMSEFFPHVRRSLRISEEQKAMIARLQLKARQGGGAIGHQEDNLEHVLSFTLFGLMSANAPAGAAAPEATQLIDCLRRVYSAESAIAEVEGNRANLTRFFGFTKTNLSPNVKSLTVVTTNYDALTEYAMFTLGERAYLPGTENASPDNGQGLYAPALSRISLCKLHGSVSWLKGADDKVDVNGQLWYRTLQGAGPNGSDLQVRRPACCSDAYTPEASALIVPPTFFKTGSSKIIDAAWRHAWDALSVADKVVVAGYSFPPSDAYMRYFLASALADNLQVGRVTIIDPNASAIVERLTSRNGGFGPNLASRLHGLHETWERSIVSLADEQTL